MVWLIIKEITRAHYKEKDWRNIKGMALERVYKLENEENKERTGRVQFQTHMLQDHLHLSLCALNSKSRTCNSEHFCR